MTNLFRRWMPLAFAALVTGCGGGGGDAPPPDAVIDEVPDNASASPQAMVDYLATLVAHPTDDGEPLSVTRFHPPMPEDTEPEPLR
ncbi:hypothetical protein [Piscinibacter sp.]|uniref:hypothetical protein n=1 Tax=Piscinibacter sp. TaxID=1903157 RepID=UPI002D18EE1D|nr:hypothetical protein [Albitalea sp.]HUG24262.1 hypothetical protein [Albitalea sp.]